MMKLHKLAIITLALTTALSACANANAPAGSAPQESSSEADSKAADKASEAETDAPEETAAETESAGEPETEAAAESAAVTAESSTAQSEAEEEDVRDQEEYPVFADMEDIVFGFMSGVGAWETTLKVSPDGSFAGEFFDVNMGETGEGFPGGTMYECSFTGRFAPPVQKNDLTWTTEVAELSYETEKDGSDQYIDKEEMLHIMTSPYGLSKGDSIEILLPGTPYGELTEDFLSWMTWRMKEGSDLPETALYNTSQKLVFYPDHYASGDINETAVPEENQTDSSKPSSVYELALNAYADQKMPDYYLMPYVPVDYFVPSKPYQSVTAANLQGRWVNRYTEGGGEIEEILTVNGDRARIECYRDGVPTYAWNGEGTFSIEDRSDRNLCPAFRIISDNGENVCTIYIRWVKENAFYDGGFLNEWKRETLEDPYQQYLYDTVTLENLQGLWYSEYEDGAGLYMVLLNIEGDKGWIFETVADRISSVWNGEGPVSIVMTNLMGDIWYPELLLSREDGPATGGIAGIYISSVDKERFYDAGLKRWFVKITEDYGSDFENMYDSGVEYFEDGSVSIEGGNLYMITPKGTVAEDGSCADWSVKVTLQDGTEQILPHQISPDSIYIPAGDGLVYEADVNFDDLPDVLLLKGVTGARAEVFFDCYLNQGDMLVPCRGFSEIPDAFPDDVSHQIIGTARDSANSYFELHYIIDGNAVRKIDEIRYEYDEALQDYVPKN